MSMGTITQSVIVTGAASGIGKACVDYLLKNGHRVLAVDLDLDRLNTGFTDPDQKLDFCAADISKTEDCSAIVDQAENRFGKVDALIHWAGIHSTKTWDEITSQDFDRVLRVNVTGSFLVVQAVARRMKETGGGSIVLTGSTSVIHGATGEITGTGGPAYVTSKAAITGLVRTLANALGRHKIRVNAIVPGATDTAMTANYNDTTLKQLSAMSPLGRIASAEDIAEAGCFLISNEARYISGESLIVNGASIFG